MLGTRIWKLGLAAASILLMAAALISYGCSGERGTTTSQPRSTVSTTSPGLSTTTTGEQSTTTSSALPPTAPSLPPSPPSEGLTLEQARNAEITVEFEDQVLTVALSDGSYHGPGGEGGLPLTVVMADVVAFGDLDGDAVGDAAIVVNVSTAAEGGSGAGGSGAGGSGAGGSAAGGSAAGDPAQAHTSAFVVALVSQGPAPVQAGYHPLDPGTRVDALSIDGPEIRVRAEVPGPEDPGGEPVVPLTAAFRLLPDPGGTWLLVHTSQTTTTPAGDERRITITSPEWGASVVYVSVISGTVTIAPFENNLAYAVYDTQLNELTSGPLAVEAPDLGAPGTFELVLDLIALGCWGEIFVTISDLSAADGSILAMDSILLENFAPG